MERIVFTYTEPVDKKFIKGVLGEFIGTLMFLWITISTVCFNVFPDTVSGTSVPQTVLSISLCFGFSIMCLIYMFENVSGANLNPAVSLSLFLDNRMSALKAGSYMVAQCIGAIAGTALAKYAGGDRYEALGTGAINMVTPGVKVGAAIIGETIMTWMLCSTVLITTDPAKLLKATYSQTIMKGAIFPFVIGMVVYLAHSCLIPITNCSINPARSFGTSVIANLWTDHYVFWLGPFLGSALSVITWRLLWQEEAPVYQEESNQTPTTVKRKSKLLESALTEMTLQSIPEGSKVEHSTAAATLNAEESTKV